VLAEENHRSVSSNERVIESVSGALTKAEVKEIGLYYGAAQAVARWVSISAEPGKVTLRVRPQRCRQRTSALCARMVGQYRSPAASITFRRHHILGLNPMSARGGDRLSLPQGREIFRC